MRIKLLMLVMLASFWTSQAQLVALIGDSQPPTAPVVGGETLSNFQVADAEPTRITFDASGPITGISTTGMEVSGRSISSVVVDGDGLGGYVVVSPAIQYGEIVTLEIIGGDGTALDFPKEYVANNVAFSGTERYVTVTGAGTKDGTSLANAWSLTELNAAAVSAGTRVNIQKGSYSGTVDVDSGTLGNHVIYEGFDTTPGDLDWATYHPVYGDALSAANMPLFTGASGTCISVQNKSYITFKNLQFTGYAAAIKSQSTSETAKFIHIDNCNAQDMTLVGFQIDAKDNTYTATEMNRAINCYVETAASTNYWLDGNDGFNYNCFSYDDNTVDTGSTDYMMYVEYGNGVVWRDCHIEKVGDTNHDGHGYSFKSLDGALNAAMGVYDSWIVDSYSKNIQNAIDFRHQYVQDNVATGMLVDGSGGNPTSGVVFRDGCKNNKVEYSKFVDMNNNSYGGIVFRDSSGEEGANQLVSGCEVSNCVFDGSLTTFNQWIHWGEGNAIQVQNNKFYNNTVIGYQKIMRNYANTTDLGGHQLVGNIMTSMTRREHVAGDPDITFSAETDNDYDLSDNTGNPVGSNNNVSVAPVLNATTYVPAATFTSIDMTKIVGVDLDFYKATRESTTTMGAVKSLSE